MFLISLSNISTGFGRHRRVRLDLSIVRQTRRCPRGRGRTLRQLVHVAQRSPLGRHSRRAGRSGRVRAGRTLRRRPLRGRHPVRGRSVHRRRPLRGRIVRRRPVRLLPQLPVRRTTTRCDRTTTTLFPRSTDTVLNYITNYTHKIM